jgi:hypothetical protein
VSRALSRVALLLVWALVIWGTLLLGATVAQALEGGLRPALLALVPEGEEAAWAWMNVVAMALALVAWPTAAAIVLMRPRPRAGSREGLGPSSRVDEGRDPTRKAVFLLSSVVSVPLVRSSLRPP